MIYTHMFAKHFKNTIHNTFASFWTLRDKFRRNLGRGVLFLTKFRMIKFVLPSLEHCFTWTYIPHGALGQFEMNSVELTTELVL